MWTQHDDEEEEEGAGEGSGELNEEEGDEVSGGGGCIRFPDSLGCSGRK